MRKRLLSLLLFVVAGLSAVHAYDFSVVVPSGQTLYYNIISDSTVEITSRNSSSPYYTGVGPVGTLVISDTVTYSGTTYSVTSIGNYAFSGCSGLTSVTIPNSVTSIGEYAFYYCSGLTSVTIPNSVTSIGRSAFSGCTGLTSVTIGNSVTSIGHFAFGECTGLTSVTIGNSVTTIGNYAFGECTGLTSVTIGNSVTSIGSSAFMDCTGLTSVTIPNSVTTIGNSAFWGCSGLTSVTIPNSVTTIGNEAFHNVKHIIYNGTATGSPWGALSHNSVVEDGFFEDGFVYTDNTKTSLLRYIGTNTNVVIPNSVTTIGRYAFDGCSDLTSVTIPDSVTSIGVYAFYNCTGLTTLNFNAINCGDFSSSHPFYNCPITTINIGDSVQRIPAYFAYNRSSLTTITIPNSVTSIGGLAFRGCSGLTSVTIPNSVTSIGGLAFRGCSGLTSVTIPNSVTSIGNEAFYNCSGLTSVTIPNSVTSIGGLAFSGCSGLTSVTIPNSVTSIGMAAFNNVRHIIYNGTATGSPWGALSHNGFVEDGFVYTDNTKTVLLAYIGSDTNVVIPNSVTSIGNSAFNGCTGLTSVTIPNSVTTIGNNAFYNCTGLTSVTIGNSVTTIGDAAFSGCTGLTTLNFNAINCGDFSSSYPFYNCPISTINIGDSVQRIPANFMFPIYDYLTSLTSVTIPNSVTTIGNSAFKYCYGLTSVTIGNSVTSIGEDAFAYCTGLTSVTIPDSVTSIGENAFYNVKHIIYNGTATGSPWGALSHNGFVEDGFVYADSTKTSLLAYIGSDTNVVIPNSVTSIGNSAFEDCTGLTSVTIPNSVTSIGRYAFAYCTGLTSVTIPDSVTSIGENAFYLVKHIIYNGTATGSPWGALSHNGFVEDGFVYTDNTKTVLKGYIGTSTNVTIPNSVITIGPGAFYGCSGLTSVTIPNSVTSIECFDNRSMRCTGAFYGCSGLTSVTIGNSVTFIGGEAFSNCSGLTSVTIGNSVTFIMGSAFSGCSSLHEVISLAVTPPSLQSDVFSAAGILKVPCGSENSYSSNASWSQYFDDIKEMCNLTITVTSVNDSMGTVLGGGEYDFGSPATIAAIPNIGYQFYQWNDGDVTNPRSLAVLSDSSFIATFSAISIGEEVHDTLYVDRYIYDTITNTVHDTTYVPVHDTTYITQIDTVTNTVYDTITNTVHDTVTNTVYDTVTNTVYDTIDNFVYDTVYITETDTLWLLDTIYMHDTIYIYDTIYIRDSTTGIEDVSVINAKIYSSRSRIVVEGAEGNSVMLFDMQGRLLSTKRDEYSVLEFEVPISGAYFVKIGNYKAKKIVVIK